MKQTPIPEPAMTGTMTTKGQIVVPQKLRRKFGLVPGTRVRFVEDRGVLELQPMTPGYVRSVMGMLKAHGPGTPLLLAERARDRKREEARSGGRGSR